jgi:FkbM family methyltransferase
MAVAELTRAALDRQGFFRTALAQRLAARPVGLIDVGARWGISREFAVAAPIFAALAFEPDPDEVPNVIAKGKAEDWAAFAVEATALGRDFGTLDLHLYSRANNSSIYPVSPAAKSRYALGGFDLTRMLRVPAKPLDAVVFAPGAAPDAGEVIKLDTQGSELQIMHGGARTLRERTVCVVTEAHFFRLYDGAPMFSDLDQHLRALGFTFIGFSDFQNRSSKRLDKRTHWGRERVFQADAVYFRDPATDAAPRDSRARDVAVLMALLLGYFDLALEWSGDSEPDLRRLVEDLSAIDMQAPRDEVATLLAAIERHPQLAHVLAGKFVDERRDLATFHDFPTPG